MTYPGGKGGAGVVQQIINQQPPHSAYIEPFLGSGAVLRAKRPAKFNLGFDLDLSAVTFFSDRPGCCIQRQCGIAFLETDARELSSDVLIYCDPPYLMETRSSGRLYRHKMTDADHIRLLEAICRLRCMVQISGYASKLYAQKLKGWRLVKFRAMTRRGVRIEHLWMNYPEPKLLHDYKFLGCDYRERERIKRKANRWTSRLDSLPRLEMLAIYQRMASSIGIFGDGSDRAGGIAISGERIPRAAVTVTSGDPRRRPTSNSAVLDLEAAASAAMAMIDRSPSQPAMVDGKAAR